jgi:hypothetical protein
MRGISACPAESIGFTPSPDSTEHRRRDVGLPSAHIRQPPPPPTQINPSNSNMSRNCPLSSPMHFYAAFSGMNREGWLTSYYLQIYIRKFLWTKVKFIIIIAVFFSNLKITNTKLPHIKYQCIMQFHHEPPWTGMCPHCNENPIYVFLFWELRGLSPNFHIHVSVRDLYIPRIGPHTVFPAAE